MAAYRDYYIVNIYHNNALIDIEPNIFSFALSDSIYNLYNTGTIAFHDSTGLYQEYLGTTEGNNIDIEFGDKDNSFKSKFVITHDNIQEFDNPGKMAGYINIHLINQWAQEQKKLHLGFKNRISKIISDKVSNVFTDTDIDDTGNEDYWLQAGISDAQFITEILLPASFSRNANDTPFYVYITSDNYFNFKNYYAMSNEEIITSIDYKVDPGSLSEYKGNQNLITSLNRWHTNMMETWHNQKKQIYRIKRTDGTLDKQEISLTDIPPATGRKTTIMKSHNDYTSYLNLGFDEEVTGCKENLLGFQAASLKNITTIDHMLINIPFNPLLKSGKLIQLNVYLEEDKLSPVFSGINLIEHCEHIWNGLKNVAFTKLMLGKKYIQIPNSYLLKPNLL